MKKITVSAPGKLMLLGEHAVVYNKPCLVTAIDQRMRLTLEALNKPEFHLQAPDVGVSNYKKPMSRIGKGDIPKGAKFVEIALKNVIASLNPSQLLAGASLQLAPKHSEADYKSAPANLSGRESISPPDKGADEGARLLDRGGETEGVLGIKITTKSEFSSEYGLGSSSASAVCTIKALSELFKLNLTPKEIFDLSHRTVLDIQGAGSGFDVAAAVYGGTIYFLTGGKKIEPLAVNNLPLIIGYSGVKADTIELMNKVKGSFEQNPYRLNEIYNAVEVLVKTAKKILVTQHNVIPAKAGTQWEKFGKLMNKNQEYLFELGVSTEKLNIMIKSAIEAGAYGAKLSGAGGGDCIIAITPERNKKEVEKAIKKAGGEVIQIKTNAEGVKVEK